MTISELPLPPFYNRANVVNDTRWIDYEGLQQTAKDWRKQYGIKVSRTDQLKVGVLVIDAQNTFCHPKGELYVAGANGMGAVEDSQRLVEFGYRNLGLITGWECTLDTHRAYAVFHSSFLVDANGNHPAPFTMVTNQEIKSGVWKPSLTMLSALGISLPAAMRHLEDYTFKLEDAGRYALTVWPYHGMLGDKGHNLVSGLAELANFHGFVRGAQPGFEVKGTHPLVENYSALGAEIAELFDGTVIQRNVNIIKQLKRYDRLIIAGQAKSHCVAWTIDDLLREVLKHDRSLAQKVYILEDCTTAIVVKDSSGNVVYDYNPDADKAIAKFQNAGMNVVKSTDPISSWPNFQL